MPRNHTCKICDIRRATVKFGDVYLCTTCNNRLLDATGAEGPAPDRVSMRQSCRRLRLPNDLIEMAERYATCIRKRTGSMIDWRDVVRDCVENALRRAMKGDSQAPPKAGNEPTQ